MSWCVRSKIGKQRNQEASFVCLSSADLKSLDAKIVSSYLLYHLLILGTHSTQSKVKLRSRCVGCVTQVQTVTATGDCLSFPLPQTPESTSVPQEVLLHSFTLWWLSRPPIHCHNTFIYTGCAIAPRQKSKHRSHSTAH
jgi:hypothetical protein